MLALTLIRPWSCALSRGPKPIENRSWAPPRKALGQVIAFHGGKRWDRDASVGMRANIFGAPPLWPGAPSADYESPQGVVGAGRLVGYMAPDGALVPAAGYEVRFNVRRLEGETWYTDGSYGWVFDERVSFDDAIPCGGAQGLWRLGDYPAAVAQAHLDVAGFNAAHPVGTPVRYWSGRRFGDGQISRTREPACMMSGHGSVWLEGVSGSIALSHVEALPSVLELA